MKRESQLKSNLRTVAIANFPNYVFTRIEDMRTNGTPDIIWTGNKHDSWIEVKHADPKIDWTGKTKGIQWETMKKLARAGYARYLVYQEMIDGEDKRSYIVHPDSMPNFINSYETYFLGYHHLAVLNYIREVNHG